MRCLLFLTLAALVAVSEVKGQGCTPYQQWPGHTMCTYWAKACPGYTLLRSGDLTCAEKTEVLAAHNMHRQNVANGTVAGQPAAADMAELVWDDELAMIAQRWADQCSFGHDAERRVSRFQVGQNVYQASRSPVDPNQAAPMTAATNAWYNEVTSPGFNPANIEPFVYSPGTGHYTQVAWAQTHTIGCGYAMYQDGSWSRKMIVCNYGIAGNVIGGRMYRQGSPNCSAYPNHSQSPRYSALCEIAGSNPPGTGCVDDEVKTEERVV